MTQENAQSNTGSIPDLAQQNQVVFDRYEHTIDQFLQVADVEQAYGKPIEHAGYIVIPTAEVVAGMGFGVGSGGATGDEGQGGFGNGGGGGGRSFSRPVAVIVASDQGVEVQPVLDVSKIALTALTAFGFMIATLARFSRGPQDE